MNDLTKAEINRLIKKYNILACPPNHVPRLKLRGGKITNA